MNWNTFFTGAKHHGTGRSEDDPETEEEDVTDSNVTVSTEKISHFLGKRFQDVTDGHFSQKCIRTIFLTSNATTFIAGIVGVVTSVWTLTDDRIMSRLIGHRIFLITLLFVGLIGSLASLLGIIGLAQKLQKYLMIVGSTLLSFLRNIYIFLCLLFLCVIFVTAISSFWIVDKILKNVHTDMVTAMRNYDSSSSSKRSWDSTHRYLKCCGIQSSRDWIKYEISIPKSCCATVIEECIQITEVVAFKSGCLQNAALLLKSHVHAISITALLIFLILLINFSLALGILFRMKKRRSSRRESS